MNIPMMINKLQGISAKLGKGTPKETFINHIIDLLIQLERNPTKNKTEELLATLEAFQFAEFELSSFGYKNVTLRDILVREKQPILPQSTFQKYLSSIQDFFKKHKILASQKDELLNVVKECHSQLSEYRKNLIELTTSEINSSKYLSSIALKKDDPKVKEVINDVGRGINFEGVEITSEDPPASKKARILQFTGEVGLKSTPKADAILTVYQKAHAELASEALSHYKLKGSPEYQYGYIATETTWRKNKKGEPYFDINNFTFTLYDKSSNTFYALSPNTHQLIPVETISNYQFNSNYAVTSVNGSKYEYTIYDKSTIKSWNVFNIETLLPFLASKQTPEGKPISLEEKQKVAQPIITSHVKVELIDEGTAKKAVVTQCVITANAHELERVDNPQEYKIAYSPELIKNSQPLNDLHALYSRKKETAEDFSDVYNNNLKGEKNIIVNTILFEVNQSLNMAANGNNNNKPNLIADAISQHIEWKGLDKNPHCLYDIKIYSVKSKDGTTYIVDPKTKNLTKASPLDLANLAAGKIEEMAPVCKVTGRMNLVTTNKEPFTEKAYVTPQFGIFDVVIFTSDVDYTPSGKVALETKTALSDKSEESDVDIMEELNKIEKSLNANDIPKP